MAWPGPVWKRETMRSPRWTWQSNAQQCFQGAVFESWFSGSVMLANVSHRFTSFLFHSFPNLDLMFAVGQKIKFFPHQVVLFIFEAIFFLSTRRVFFFLFKRCAFRTYVVYTMGQKLYSDYNVVWGVKRSLRFLGVFFASSLQSFIWGNVFSSMFDS